MTRKVVNPDQDIHLQSAVSAYICRVPLDILSHDPELEYMTKEKTFWLGEGRMAVCDPVLDEYDMTLPFISEEGNFGDWNHYGDPAEIRKQYASFHPSLRKVLEHIDRCKLWRLTDLPPLDRWFSRSGKVVILGDAAHAMSPYGGQVSAETYPTRLL